ncbi:MAG: UDP-N-acetylmuramate:L-alanyl-gamma-D-glutamyl-meso-diaminopimelate ligase [Deltaproteobacteria bacterium]|nr:UDP-N-acetylmuramate:L-alanyl-gamma-D-glutamyl-meso-diaminopimelate ligase [Deltaproteobacteria bacterium]
METRQQNTAVLIAQNNTLPSQVRHIHLMGICGTGMASLAGMLKDQGFLVTGSDQNVYPPMSTYLDALSIPIFQGYQASNLHESPDLVIVGNVITRSNPEAIELARRRLPYLSMPQAIHAFALKGKKSIVIAGTHGKTTTTALVSWVLECAGLDPGYLIGGIPVNFGNGFRQGKGIYFVIEGDEYDTAFFDKGPKFLHYSPWIVILTSIEFDHADIYRDLEHVRKSFRNLLRMLPSEGRLIANMDDPLVVAESEIASCPVISYGLGNKAFWSARNISVGYQETSLEAFTKRGEAMEITTPLYGRHNISNLLSALALADFLNVKATLILKAFESFRGVKRRQEVKGEKNGILVLDDFAHHPTAVRETIKAVREKYQGRRIIAAFEPRSNSSRRNTFQRDYVSCFDQADLVMIPEPPFMEKIPLEERFSSRQLVEDLQKRGTAAYYFPETSLLLERILRVNRRGDVVLIMSNGAFDNLAEKLLKGLRG